MRITAKTRYGTCLMLQLALHYNQRTLFLKDIAHSIGISEKYLGQIVIPLLAADLIYSVRGAHGGYALNRSPADISIREIFETLEGKIELVKATNNTAAQNSAASVSDGIWQELQAVMCQKLESIRLDTLVDLHRQKGQGVSMYNI